MFHSKDLGLPRKTITFILMFETKKTCLNLIICVGISRLVARPYLFNIWQHKPFLVISLVVMMLCCCVVGSLAMRSSPLPFLRAILVVEAWARMWPPAQ